MNKLAITIDEFVPVKGYEDKYLVANDGRVFSIRKNKLLKPIPNEKGYLSIELWDNYTRKSVKVHRLVAETFIPNPNARREINHKDGNKQNNNVDNLEWCTRSENLKHAYAMGLKKQRRKHERR